MSFEWRVPGGVPLTVQVLLGFGALALVCGFPALRLFATPYKPLPFTFAPLGTFGWFSLVLVAGAGFWHVQRVAPDARSLVLAFAGLVAGVLVAAGASGWDQEGQWVSFHALALTWAAAAFAFFAALEHVEKEPTGDVPNPLKDASRDKKGLGHGEGYKYPHAYRDHYVPEQYLPGGMQGTYFYEPSDQGFEARVAGRLADLRARDAEQSVEKRARRYARPDDAPDAAEDAA